jgi:hypothetical protein
MARSLKVYGWTGFYPREFMLEAHKNLRERRVQTRNCRYIMAAESKAEVYRLTGKTARDFYVLSETGNDREIEVALAEPRTLFVRDEINHTPGEKVYVRLDTTEAWA